jgi:hypothetical protein
MSSQGSGADISEQEADDLLHKLITEATKVQAAYAGAIAGLAFLITGILKVSPGLVWVTAGDTLTSPHISFDPTQAVARKYADLRAFPGATEKLAAVGAPGFASAPVFVFRDGSQLSLFEIDRPA